MRHQIRLKQALDTTLNVEKVALTRNSKRGQTATNLLTSEGKAMEIQELIELSKEVSQSLSNVSFC